MSTKSSFEFVFLNREFTEVILKKKWWEMVTLKLSGIPKITVIKT